MIRGRFRAAVSYYQAVLHLQEQRGDQAGRESALQNLGTLERELRNPASATAYFGQSIAAYKEVGDKLGAAVAMSGLARAKIDLGSLDQAAEHLQHSLAVFREGRDKWLRMVYSLAAFVVAVPPRSGSPQCPGPRRRFPSAGGRADDRAGDRPLPLHHLVDSGVGLAQLRLDRG